MNSKALRTTLHLVSSYSPHIYANKYNEMSNVYYQLVYIKVPPLDISSHRKL